jgi:hypothetical protein
MNPLSNEPESAAFANSNVPPTVTERLIAEIIWRRQGRKNAISIDVLHRATGKSERDIKAAVHELVVTHRMRVGSSRATPVGYFVIVDAEDLAAAVEPYRAQIVQMWRRLRVLSSRHELAELHGQLSLED